MARGWESKAVADQIEEGKQSTSAPAGQHASAAERQRQGHLESLRLSRSRLLEQLERAQQPAYREMLLKGLRAIEQEIETVMSRPAE